MRLLPLAIFVAIPLSAQSVPYTPGMIITHSVRIRPGHYAAPSGDIAAPSRDSAALTIRGDNIILDLTGVELIGNPRPDSPDQFAGTAVRIDGGRNITIKGLHARGYKVGIIARGVTRLSLLNNDLSYNWRPRLYSGIVKESLIDWLDYHQNEKDEWLRYGAGIYLADVTIAEIKGNKVLHGMNGLMMTRTTGARVWNNSFSFNSGIGLGMYRASRNTIMHNWLDYDVRGYSHGFYNRGQDSAGLLMYEQCSNNTVAYNSVTHSGDGLFLWAGQTTMDNGRGGANDNVFYHNDFSFAPTNGIEATFSRNAFIDNVVEGNWHGLWGGYSFNSVILGNRFVRNVEGIAIEHGQDNSINGNSFVGDTVAIHLWWNRVEPSDWGYPKSRDTRSMRYSVENNSFSQNHVAFRVDNTTDLRIGPNRFTKVDTVRRQTGDSAGLAVRGGAASTALATQIARYRVPPLPGAVDALQPVGPRRDRSSIVVDKWGPYDWKSPKLWPVGRDDGPIVRLRVLGPPGRWTAQGFGATVTPVSGRVGDTITVVPEPGREGDFQVMGAYKGAATTTQFGERHPAGMPSQFSWKRFNPFGMWHVTFVPFDSTKTALSDPAAITRALQGLPVATLDTNQLDLTWYGPPRKAIPQSNVLTQATTTITLEGGIYILWVIADDAVRVFVDDKLVVDDLFKTQESHVYLTNLSGDGARKIRVEHLQLTGWYELKLWVTRVNEEPQ